MYKMLLSAAVLVGGYMAVAHFYQQSHCGAAFNSPWRVSTIPLFCQ